MKIKKCPRCEKECIAEKTGNQNARPLRKSDKGMCLECAATRFIMSLPSAGMFEPKALLLPHVRSQFEVMLSVGDVDQDTYNIDWNRLIENWELPFPSIFAPKRP